MAAKRPKVPPTDPADLIAAALEGGNAPRAGGDRDGVAEDFADALNDDRLQDGDDDDERDDEPIEDEGPQPPIGHIDEVDLRVRGDVVPFTAAPMLRMGRINSQVPTINVYKQGIDGKLVCVGDAPIGIGPQAFYQRFFHVMPRPGESPGIFQAVGVNAAGQEVSQTEMLPLIDPNHTYLQQLRASGFGQAQAQSFGGVPGMSSLQDVMAVVDQLAAPDRARLAAERATQVSEFDAKEKRLQAELADVRAARAAADANLAQQQQNLVTLALENGKEQVRMHAASHDAQLAAVKETSQASVQLATTLADATVKMHQAAAETAKSEAAAKVQTAKQEADERMKDSDRRQQLEIARMRNETDLQIARAQAASAEAIARTNADSAARVAEAQAMYKWREATAGINANSPNALLSQGLELLKAFGSNPQDALKRLAGGSDVEMIAPIVAEVGEVLGKAVDGIGVGIAAYMQENTKREELKLREKEFEARKAAGMYTPPVVHPQPAGLLAMNQFPPPNLQNPPQPVLTPMGQPSTAGPQPVAAAPSAPPPPAAAAPVTALPLPQQKEARLTATAIVDSLRAMPRDRWLGIAADMIGRVPALAALMRERTFVTVLVEAQATPPMVAGLLEDLLMPANAAAIPADIPRGQL